MTTPAGVVVNDGTLADVHASAQRVLVNQVRQGILAERLGFDYFFMTEHHFQPEGAEFSPNPLLTETAIAAQTKRIRLGQAANILTWWHPIRIAEQAAMLDVIPFDPTPLHQVEPSADHRLLLASRPWPHPRAGVAARTAGPVRGRQSCASDHHGPQGD
ncbi:MAG: LLM class flavin-dependent oxidoreductase [Nitrospinae bacterium]|nr:LLM class flavin-dependent oxidoreductase [Nitrospinota bacterium]